jgi:hypothetical protein
MLDAQLTKLLGLTTPYPGSNTLALTSHEREKRLETVAKKGKWYVSDKTGTRLQHYPNHLST